MSYGWLFENPDDGISGGNHINLEHLPPELNYPGDGLQGCGECDP